MVKVEIVIPAQSLRTLTEALGDLGYRGITVSDLASRQYGDEARHFRYRGRDFVPMESRLRVELVIPDRRIEEALETLEEVAGKGADTQITVSPVLDVIRIRTGERGEDAVGG